MLNTFSRYISLFLQLKCVPRKHKRDHLEHESLPDPLNTEGVLHHTETSTTSETDIVYYMDAFMCYLVDEVGYDRVMREFLNDLRARVVELHCGKGLDAMTEHYIQPR